MHISRNRLAGLALCGVIVVGLTVAILGGPVGEPVLVVTDETGEDLLRSPVDSGDTVVLEYMHSVEKTTVRDVYEVRPTGLVMTEMEFSSYGYGLPSTAPINMTDEGTFIYNVTPGDPDSLRVATGEIADHDLVIDGDRVDLAGIASYDSVVIAVERELRL